jgi:hypothetical protein
MAGGKSPLIHRLRRGRFIHQRQPLSVLFQHKCMVLWNSAVTAMGQHNGGQINRSCE